MLEMIVAIGVVWAIVTLIGHLSWISVAAIVRAMFKPDLPPKRSQSPADDVAATHRVIRRLTSALLIGPEEASRMRGKLDQLADRAWSAAATPAEEPSLPVDGLPAASSTMIRQTPERRSRSVATQSEPVVGELDLPNSVEGHVICPAGVDANPSTGSRDVGVAPVVAHGDAPVPDSVMHDDSAARRPSTPRASLGRSMAEFLAQHNIRWGELIAGLLIVVCSIGLVLSLWTTITQMHRVIPSLIFLTGNTAIFGAGLYTLFRWRLQDTSRATLVIAMLLVPLGILTGLSTGGIDGTSVLLDDPITVLSIVAAGAVYLTLIWQASRALVGSSIAWAMTLGLAGPAAVLPFIPAAIRTWDESAGFVTYAGSFAVASAVVWMVTRNRTLRGNAAVRRALVIAVAGFSLVVLAGYAAFMLRESETAWRAIAIAALPGVILLAAASGSLAGDTRRPKLALAASAFALMGTLAGGVMIVPSMASMGWLWGWAISFSVATMVAAFVLHSPRWTMLATLPIGLALVLSSSAWGSAVAWEEIPIWRRLFGGEPMLASLAVSLVSVASAYSMRDPLQKKSLVFSGAGWLGYATTNAMLLTVAPVSLMGAVAPWLLPALLASVWVAILLAARRESPEADSNWCAGTIVAVLFAFWLSALKPLVIGQPFPGLQTLLLTLLATAISGILSAEAIARSRFLGRAVAEYASVFLLGTASIATFLGMQRIGAAETDGFDMRVVIGTLLASLWGWIWIGLTARKEVHLVLARVFLVVTAVVVGRHYFADALMTAEAWRNGSALWCWSALGWSVVAAIGLRNLTLGRIHAIPRESSAAFLAQRADWYQPQRHAWDVVSEGAAIVCATILAALASAIAFGSLILAVGFESSVEIYRSFAFPVVVLIFGAVVLMFGPVLRGGSIGVRSVLKLVYLLAGLLWLGWQVAIRTIDDPVSQLITATSLASAGCFLLNLYEGDGKDADSLSRRRGTLVWMGLALIAVASATLLAVGWVRPVADGIRPDRLITFAVAIWWTVAAITSAWLGRRNGDPVLACVAAALVPSLVVLLTPSVVPAQWWIWIQSAAIASGLYAIAMRCIGGGERGVQPAVDLSMAIGTTVGIASCVALILGILRRDSAWMQLHQPAGMILASLSVGLILYWNRLVRPAFRFDGEIVWPLMLSLTSGHLTLVMASVATPALNPHRLLPIVWILVAVVSIVELGRSVSKQHQVGRSNGKHAGLLIAAASMLCMIDGSIGDDFAIGLIACAVGGALATARTIAAYRDRSRGISTLKRTMFLARGWCWYVTGMGSIFVFRWVEATSRPESMIWTLLIAWIGSWALLWRFACPDRGGQEDQDRNARRMLADGEVSVFVLIALALETVAVWIAPSNFADMETLGDGQFWIRLAFGAALAVSVCLRFRRRAMLEVAVATAIVSATLLGLRLGVERDATPVALATIVCLVVSTVFTGLVFVSSVCCSVINGVSRQWTAVWPGGNPLPALSIPQFARALTRVGTLLLTIVIGFSGWMLIQYNSDTLVPMAICGVALLSAALAELSERTGRESVRQVAMMVGLASIAMWASVNVVETPMPLVTLSTRWFVGWVVIAAAIAFAVPKLIGSRILSRWKSAIRSGLAMSLSLAVGSLLITLFQEGVVRLAGQADRLDKPLFLGMAAALALLSLCCTVAGILSGPGYSYRDAWRLTDRQRANLIVAAQVFGGLTWFHLFLCKSPLASLGLRAYWPYVVMALSFASVGVTQWARRRRDQVLADTLKRTALFLPLIPVIGFWLSGSLVTALFGASEAGGWNYIQGRVSYQAVLIAVALYYGVVSFLWNSGRARLVSILIGNLALWVILVQTPNWDFLSHPQAWLIPPALCVLIVTHWHRESLDTNLASAVRYAATLTIYVTSTADMLVQGIGSTIMGPIVLILLALCGAGAGVALRVRPFLYLGATFVFLGLTSMVWYAQEQIDAVWPWWVFGIGTGVALMIGLMALEKNRPQLHRIATSLQQWER